MECVQELLLLTALVLVAWLIGQCRLVHFLWPYGMRPVSGAV